MKSFCSRLSALFISLLFWPTPAQLTESAAPKVVVSISPFYGLVAAVMEGVGTPELLVAPGASPHHYALQPSALKKIEQAALLFWAGPHLETFLVKPLQSLATHPKASVIAFSELPSLVLHPVRKGSDCAHHAPIDMHFWLDPHNAVVLTEAIEEQLCQKDNLHCSLYHQNASKLKKNLAKLHQRIDLKLNAVQKVPFMVFHDAYQYFERRYHLKSVGAITLHPETPLSAKRLSHVLKTIESTQARCVFSEPQFQPKLIQSLLQTGTVKTAELDPLGQQSDQNPLGYFRMMERLTDAFYSCLKDN